MAELSPVERTEALLARNEEFLHLARTHSLSASELSFTPTHVGISAQNVSDLLEWASALGAALTLDTAVVDSGPAQVHFRFEMTYNDVTWSVGTSCRPGAHANLAVTWSVGKGLLGRRIGHVQLSELDAHRVMLDEVRVRW